MTEGSSSVSEVIPRNVEEKAKKASELLVPAKSEHLYIKEYEPLHKWMVKNSVTVKSATVMLAYFQGVLCSHK
jgi:predicted CopG family antitoxin